MTNNIYKKLLKVQSELKAPKNQRNNFGNYSYRSAEDILEAVKPLLKEAGLILTISDEITEIAGRFYVKSTVKLIDIDNGETIEASALAREDENKKGMDLAQVTGSCSSYARKYALNGMFAIDSSELDPDKTNTHGKEVKQKLSEAQVKRLYAIANKKGCTQAVVLKAIKRDYNLDNAEDLSKAQYEEICNKFENIVK